MYKQKLQIEIEEEILKIVNISEHLTQSDLQSVIEALAKKIVDVK